MFRLGLLFVVMTFLELFLLLQMGRWVGWPATIGVILFTGFLGAYLTRQQGFRVLLAIQEAMQRGEMPAREILHGVCILCAGAFLVTPGLITDLLGFALLIPKFRDVVLSIAQSRMERWIKQNMTIVSVYPGIPGGMYPHHFAPSDPHVYDATPKASQTKHPPDHDPSDKSPQPPHKKDIAHDREPGG